MLACYFCLCVKFFFKQINLRVCRFSSCTMHFFCTCFPIFMNLSWRYLLELKLKDKCFILFFKFKITIKFYCAAYFQSQTVKFSIFFLFCWSEVEIRGKFYFDSRLGPIGPQDIPITVLIGSLFLVSNLSRYKFQ